MTPDYDIAIVGAGFTGALAAAAADFMRRYGAADGASSCSTRILPGARSLAAN